MDEDEERKNNISFKNLKKEDAVSSFLISFGCDYTSIIINNVITTVNIRHQILLSSSSNHQAIPHISGIHNSTNKIAHTIVRNICLD